MFGWNIDPAAAGPAGPAPAPLQYYKCYYKCARKKKRLLQSISLPLHKQTLEALQSQPFYIRPPNMPKWLINGRVTT